MRRADVFARSLRAPCSLPFVRRRSAKSKSPSISAITSSRDDRRRTGALDERQSVRGDHGNAARRSINTICRSPRESAAAYARRTSRYGPESFTLTLPKAASTGGMSSRTRSAWNSFAAFAKRHEAWHQSSYTGCARVFVAKAERMSGKQCLRCRAISERRSTG